MNELENLEQLLDELLRGIQDVIQSGEILSDEFQGLIAQELETTSNRIDELRAEQANEPVPPEEPPPNISAGIPLNAEVQLLWVLSGQNEQAFLQYLTNFPSQNTAQLLRNPDELQRVIQQLQQEMPSGGQLPVADGIQHAPINSSNIYGFRYNPQNGNLKVRFQSGSVYEYDAVPSNIFNAFRQGASAARTDGQNQFGRWWRGKNPSLGAAFWNYIRNAGFDYRRLR